MIRRHLREISVAAVLAALLLTLARTRPDFYGPANLVPLIVQCAPVLVAAVGMTLVIVSRHIDISIGSQFSICAVVAGLLALAGLPMPLVAVGAVLAGTAMGAVNGALIAGLGLPSIVVTLATWVIGRESLRWWRHGEPVRNLPPSFQWFGFAQLTGQLLVVGIALAVLLLFAWALRYFPAGRAVYATGSDAEAARLAGIRPRRVVFGVFVVMGALAGLAALLNVVRFPVAPTNTGNDRELEVIAAVVVGGTAISGGRGTLLGTLLGVVLLVFIGQGLNFLGIPSQWARAVQGGIILLAAASDALGRRGSR
jgi:rhamnose transport system permease protein